MKNPSVIAGLGLASARKPFAFFHKRLLRAVGISLACTLVMLLALLLASDMTTGYATSTALLTGVVVALFLRSVDSLCGDQAS